MAMELWTGGDDTENRPFEPTDSRLAHSFITVKPGLPVVLYFVNLGNNALATPKYLMIYQGRQFSYAATMSTDKVV
jgi:hypothetical protein